MKRFLTIFLPATNIHLMKDVGMIPYILHKELQYVATLACYKNDNYVDLEKEVKGLNIIYVKKIFYNQFLDVLFFLLLNSKKYDVLQVYHLGRSQLIWCFFFKVIRFGRVKTYLKLDADDGIMKVIPSKLTQYFLKHLSLITVESSFYAHQLNQQKQLAREVFYLPNGFYDHGNREQVSFTGKENKIITVGRIGTTQKATEILCNAFARFALNNKDWQLVIIGPIAGHFKSFIVNYFNLNPSIKNRVVFTGTISDKEELQHHYRSAKLFVLSSRYEGFPLVLPEAARFGCCIVSTDLPSARAIISEDKYGRVFPVDDEQELSSILTELCQNQSMLKSTSAEIQDFAYQHFYWPIICKNLDALLWKN